MAMISEQLSIWKKPFMEYSDALFPDAPGETEV
jgi:hypothetical protein